MNLSLDLNYSLRRQNIFSLCLSNSSFSDENKIKNKKNPGNQTPCHYSFSGGIMCGPHRGSFSVRDYLRSSLGIISGLGIIWGRGSFAALYSSRKWLLKDLNSNMEYYIQLTE